MIGLPGTRPDILAQEDDFVAPRIDEHGTHRWIQLLEDTPHV